MLGLPAPYPGDKRSSGLAPSGDAPAEKTLALPRLLRRDTLWLREGPPQLEFVVDNETLAGLANIEMISCNVFYDQHVRRIRDGLKHAFANHFAPKAGYLNPVKWRPREFNTPPDTVCNWVLARQSDVAGLPLHFAMELVEAGWSLQVHCDGGYRGGVGAAAFVVHAHCPAESRVKRVGYCGVFLPTARSAFHSEITALTNAIDWITLFIRSYRTHARARNMMSLE